MTKRKEVAKTLLEVLDHPFMIDIMDRDTDLTDVINDVSEWWVYDLYERKPAPALIDGEFKGTDLDLACFLSTLAYRNANINIPVYHSMRPKTIREGVKVTSDENRNGPIISLTANKDVFSFGVKIRDNNVIDDGVAGVPRSFSITAPDGEWYKGWQTIQWDPTKKENKFLTENELFTGNKIYFKHFVHPARSKSLYGHYYFITKVLIDRLEEESNNYFIQIKRMLADGIKFIDGDEESPKDWGKSMTADGKSVEFKTLEVVINVPEFKNDYPIYKSNLENLKKLYSMRKNLVYRILPNLRFSTRVSELAFMKYDDGRIPHWLKNCKWEENYVKKGKRVVWDRLVLFQPSPGVAATSILKRIKTKSEIMAKDYNNGRRSY